MAARKENRRGVGPSAEIRRSVSPARRRAFEILRRVEEEGAFAAHLLAEDAEALRADDRALCYELVLGVLRRQLWLDHLIAHFAARSPERLDAPVRRALRLALYQLRFLSRIPASAVVNEAVNLAYVSRVRSAAPFINAVLRKSLKEPLYDPARTITDPLARLSVESSQPLWLIERWTKAFGPEVAEQFARANLQAPPVAFRIVKARAMERDVLEELRAAGAELTPSQLVADSWRVRGASALLRELARDGIVYVQDEASQLAARLLEARPRERVLDVCAAPGSKTTYIADTVGRAAMIVAGDLYEHRLRTLLDSSARQAARSVSAVAYDATVRLPFTARSFDRVLVDAPCTGTGTLRRNPEIRWRITPSDIAELAARQRAILSNAAEMLRPGGRLLYSTCSVEPEENEAVAASFLEEQGAFREREVDVPARLRTASGRVRTWPQRDGTDGFFIAAFERRS